MGYPVDRLSQHQWMYGAGREHAALGSWVARRRRSGWGLHELWTGQGKFSGGRISYIPAGDQSEPLAGDWIARRRDPALEHSFGTYRLETGASRLCWCVSLPRTGTRTRSEEQGWPRQRRRDRHEKRSPLRD